MEAGERNAAATLDQIRDGGAQIILTVRTRLREIEEALDAGRFNEAHQRAAELTSRLSSLANAETYMAAFSMMSVVRARDVQPGMVLRQWGTVSDVEVEEVPIPGEEPCLHMKLTFEDGEQRKVEVPADQELIAVRS